MIPSPIRSKSVYQWNMRPGFSFQGDAQAIGDRLEAIMRQNAGALTPGVIVEDASDPASPLHPNFEWNDTRAARLQREHTARNLVGSIVIVEHEGVEVAGTIRAFVNVRQGGTTFYTTTIYAMSDTELAKQVLQDAYRELVSWRKKYSDLKELAAVMKTLDDFVFPILPQAA